MKGLPLITVKLVIMGDAGCGKSSLVQRFADDTFDPLQSETIGVDFKIRTLGQVKLQIWDTAGQERFRAITTAYFRNAHGIILAYDVTSRASFDSLTYWLNQTTGLCDSARRMVVGLKVDLDGERRVETLQGAEYAHSIGARFYECSAKERINVDECFMIMARDTMALAEDPEGVPRPGEEEEGEKKVVPPSIKKSSCC